MKKNYIISSAVLLAAALLVSCQNNEFKDDSYVPKDGEIVFRLPGKAKETKSSDAAVKGVTVDLGKKNGVNFYLEETITRLDGMAYGPATKGTPGKTDNFNTLYGGFNATVFRDTESSPFGDENVRFDDLVVEDKLVYRKKYDNALWDKGGVYFFLNAYTTDGGSLKGVDNLEGHPVVVAAVTEGDDAHPAYPAGSISFSYDGSTMTDAASQQDILFTSRAVASLEEYKTFVKQYSGIPAFFKHALTGVNFAIGNTSDDIDDYSIAITSVEFSGLYDSGKCIITPTDEDTDTYGNAEGEYSSADDVEWYDWEASETSYSSGDFDVPADADTNPDLNDEDYTQTFWFIPQALSRDDDEAPVLLTIHYNFGEEEDLEWTLDLSDIIGNIEWKAGELRTYTIRIDEVNLQIEDEVVEKTVEGEKTFVKENVEITNTGNVDVFIRAAIVGQWVVEDTDGNVNPIFGFTDKINQLYVVESWYQDQFGENANRSHGYFVKLAGYDQADGYNDWHVGDDGFYYYGLTVAPGGKTKALFDSYVLGTKPNAEIAGLVVDYNSMYFTLEVSTQAISARTSNGTLMTDYDAAWKAAAKGEKPSE